MASKNIKGVGVYPIQSDTVYIDIYKKICDCIRKDSAVVALLDGIVLDFDLGVGTPTTNTPRSNPRIYLIFGASEYNIESSCNNALSMEYSIVLDGFHRRDERVYKLAWRLFFLLRTLPFNVLEVDGKLFGVVCTPGATSWEYDAQSQMYTHQMNLNVVLRI